MSLCLSLIIWQATISYFNSFLQLNAQSCINILVGIAVIFRCMLMHVEIFRIFTCRITLCEIFLISLNDILQILILCITGSALQNLLSWRNMRQPWTQSQGTQHIESEVDVHMGWLVPTITPLNVKLDRLKTSSKFCQPLITALQEGIQRRFGDMLADPELIAAAILLLKFRTSWTSNDDLLTYPVPDSWSENMLVTRRKNTTALVITIIMMFIWL